MMCPYRKSSQFSLNFIMKLSFYLNTMCWNKAAGRGLGWYLDPPFSMWQWLRWYSEAFSESKPAHRDASEYHPHHSHMEGGWSKTHPVGPPVASCQHPVLSLINIGADLAFHSFSFSFHLVRRCMLTDRTEKCRLNKKLLKVGHVGSKGGSSLVNHLVD